MDEDKMCNFKRGPSYVLPTKFQFIQLSGFRRRRFSRNRQIRDKNCWWRQCLFTDRDEIRNLYRGPSIDASYQASFYFPKRFQIRIFVFIRPNRNNNCLWRPCLLPDLNKMSIHSRGPYIDASYQVSLHLAQQFQRIICVLIDQSKIRIACGGHFC